jgi:dTDP-4-amino-4,6-dideoxygalactose transaminase
MSEVSAALLLSQLEMGDVIQDSRLSSWNYLYEGLLHWSITSDFELPFIPNGFSHTAHIFYVVAPSINSRERFVTHLRKLGIPALFHYQPLHLAPAGLKYGRVGDVSLENTVSISERLLRIPIYFGMDPKILSRIISAVTSFEG